MKRCHYLFQFAKFDIGFTVQFRGTKVTAYVDDSFKGQTCGFCGNFNDNPSDDWIMGNYGACPAGTANQAITPGQKVNG